MPLSSATRERGIGATSVVIAYGRMKKALLLAAIAGAYFAGRADVARNVKLENKRVRVLEMDYKPGEPRTRSIRPADQVIVFLDDSRYERVDPDTGEKTVRTRKSGDVIWHNKGEVSPQLTNLGKNPYRTIVVELK
jgi:hypothetical protein